MDCPPLTVVRMSGDEITAERAETPIPSSLQNSVVDCVGRHEVLGRPLVRRCVPAATVTVMIGLEEVGETIPVNYPVGALPPAASTATSMVLGMHQRAVMSESRGCKMIEVEFPPLAAYTLFKLPLRELAGQFVELPQILGRTGAEMVERLAEAPGWPGRFALLEDAVERLAGDGPAPHPAVVWAWRRIVRSHGRVNIGELAAEAGWSRRHLTRQFTDQLGMAPKTVARLRRLRHAVRLLSQPRRGSIADIAACCGYYDQAHLANDFRDIAGCSLNEYLAEIAAAVARVNGPAAA